MSKWPDCYELSARHDYNRFIFVFFADQITVGKENVCLNIKYYIYKCLVSNQTQISNFHPLEVVGRGSETQLQVGEKLNYLI